MSVQLECNRKIRFTLFAVVLIPALIPMGRASAEPQDLTAMARRAAGLCKAGDDASHALRELLAGVEAEYGASHEAAELVRLYVGPSGAPVRDRPSERATDPELARAFKKLRACTPAPALQASRKPEEIRFEQHLELGFKLYRRALYRQALEAAQMAREQLDSAVDPIDTADRMKLHDLLAKIQLQLGHRSLAIGEARSADKLASELGKTANRIDYARLYAQAGDLESAQTQLDALEGVVQEPADVAEFEEVRGFHALMLGSPREALAHLQRALEGHRQSYGQDHPSTAAVLQLRGDAYRLAGDFPKAIDAYRETLRLRREVLGPKHAETARTQNAIGVLQADLGDWNAADDIFEAALRSLRETLGEESVDTITVRTNRALARWGAKGNRAAADEYATAIADLRVALGPDHPTVAAAVRNRARMEFDLGNGDAAEKLLEDALAAQIRALGEQHPDLAPTRLAHGRLLAQRGQLKAAAAEINRAINTLVSTLGPEHPVVSRARTTHARTAIAQSDNATALKEASAAAHSIALFSQRTFGAISDRQRALLSQDSQQVIGALLSVPGADARDLFLTLLPHRDSVLRSIAAGRASERGGGTFATELAELRRRYMAAVLGRSTDTAQRVKVLAGAIEGLEALQSQAQQGQGAGLTSRDPQEVLGDACKRLPADSALIKFVAYDRTLKGVATETVPAYAALVVRPDGCRVERVELGRGSEIQEFAEQFAGAMRDQRMDHPIARLGLTRTVLEPLATALEGTTRWLVVPDGSLWGIPIGVLPDPKDSNRYLLERITVGYLTSTYELAEPSEDTKKSKTHAHSLLIGAPDFGDTQNGGPIVLTDAGPCQISPFENLPATRKELEDISEILPGSRLLMGPDVTKSHLEAELNKKPWLIHFATHAYFAGSGGCGSTDPGEGLREKPISPNPLLLSGIVLAGANQPTRIEAETESGILTAYEVAGLDLRSAQLVVLSACDTGTGLALRGQEVQGLRWGFRAAGARALVTSLWKSNDAATRHMMRSFYQALVSEELESDPLRGAEALRRAKLAQLQSEARLGIRRPLIWANFIFSGLL